jgi:hypothetical protein
MGTENENEESNCYCDARRDGVSSVVAVIVIATVAVLAGAAGYFYPRSANNMDVVNTAAVRMQTEANMAIQKGVVAVQMAVIKNCSDRGNIPVLMGGNVDCKISPK